MTTAIELVLLLAGLALLVTGYRRNHRRLLAASAIVLFLAGAGADFATGFVDGYANVRADHASH